MKSLAWLFVKSPVCGWVWLFLAINVFTTTLGSVNPAARWTMMVAMLEDHSFPNRQVSWLHDRLVAHTRWPLLLEQGAWAFTARISGFLGNRQARYRRSSHAS